MSEAQITNNQLYENLLKAFNTTTEKLQSEIHQINKKLDNNFASQNRRIEEITNKYNAIEKRCVQLERKCRKNNIVIFGLSSTSEDNIAKFVIQQIKDLLGIAITENDLNNVYQLKSRNGSFIKVEFISYLKKTEVLKHVYKLKGKNVYITQDLCYEDREEKRLLKKHLNLAKEKKQNAKIRGNKLYVNEDVFTAEQLKSMEIEENADVVEEEEGDENYTLEPRSSSAPSTPLRPSADDIFSDILDKNTESNEESAHERSTKPLQTNKRQPNTKLSDGNNTTVNRKLSVENESSNLRVTRSGSSSKFHTGKQQQTQVDTTGSKQAL